MATFRIHEDICTYIPAKITNNKIGGNKIPIRRQPLRSTNNIILNKNKQGLVKKDIVPCRQIKKTVEIKCMKIADPTLKENKVSKKVETIEDLYFFEKENSENLGLKLEKFTLSSDQLYLTTEEYHENIYSYLLSLEKGLKQPKYDYMLKQPELNPKMRSILVDWLCSISEEYNMQPQTLHLAVQYVDCFLSRMSVIKSKFQLVGTAAMMIAAKYEEIYPPDTKEWAFLTADSFTPKQILKMEQLILKVLQFDVARPTAYSFINHICFVCNLPKQLMFLAMYISELVLLEGEDYIKYLPSELASASLALARYTLDEQDLWPVKLESQTGYSLQQLSPLIKRQNKSFKDSPTRPQQAIQTKFKSYKFERVSLFKPKEFDFDIMEE